MPTTAEKRKTFRKLHEAGCFVMPNPWDVGTARYLQHLGFKALATTSAGFAFSRGLPDGAVPREMMLAHLREIVDTTDVPVNADFEGGYAVEPAGVAESVRLCVETGVAGLSIEDSTGDADEPLYPIDLAAERVRAARKAIDAMNGDAVLTGRAECFIVGRPDLADAIARLKAYSEAGADCLYAPGIRTREEIAAVVAAVAPKPVNLLMSVAGELSVADIEALGVRRISVGRGLARLAWSTVADAAARLAGGSFEGFAISQPSVNMNAFFREELAKRD